MDLLSTPIGFIESRYSEKDFSCLWRELEEIPELREPAYEWFLYLGRERKVCGVLCLSENKHRPKSTHVAYIETVDGEYANGYATAALIKAEVKAYNEGKEWVTLRAHDEIKEFYEKRGFKEVDPKIGLMEKCIAGVNGRARQYSKL